TGNYRVRRIDTHGVVTTVAGSGGHVFGGAGDGGLATGADLLYPAGLAQDGAGNLYIADRAADRIRRVTPGGAITTVIGGGATTLASPYSLAAAPDGTLYIGELDSHTIRRVSPGG